MKKTKKLMMIGLLITAFLIPSTASASTGGSHQSIQTTFHIIFNSILAALENKKENYPDYNEYFNKYKDWKGNVPQDSSDKIWKKWYCY